VGLEHSVQGKLVSLEGPAHPHLEAGAQRIVAVAPKRRRLQPPCCVSKCGRVAKANLGTFPESQYFLPTRRLATLRKIESAPVR
jgi:hypothetical protein